MDDNDITEIVGWPTEPEMVKYRRIAKAAAQEEREIAEAIRERSNTKYPP